MEGEHNEPSIDEQYARNLADFRKAIREATWTSVQAGGLKSGERREWNSVLFLKVCITARSLLHLCPDLNNPFAAPHWDFSSIATLARNLFEAVAFFDYFATPVPEEEWNVRYLIMELNDNVNRVRIFEQLAMPEQVQAGQLLAEAVRTELRNSSFFLTLPPTQQRKLLTGLHPALQSLRERARDCATNPGTWGVYDYLSTHAHALPVSFMRMRGQKRTGSENGSEKTLIATIFPFCSELIDGCAARFRADRSDLHTFVPAPEDWMVCP